jgi:hypothetical protein
VRLSASSPYPWLQYASGVTPVSSQTDRDTSLAGDAGISMTTVLVMLLVLAVLVVGIFWVLPAWFGGRVIEITTRP